MRPGCCGLAVYAARWAALFFVTVNQVLVRLWTRATKINRSDSAGVKLDCVWIDRSRSRRPAELSDRELLLA